MSRDTARNKLVLRCHNIYKKLQNKHNAIKKEHYTKVVKTKNKINQIYVENNDKNYIFGRRRFIRTNENY